METLKRKPNIAIIIGSNRPRRICNTIADWVFKEMNHPALLLSIIDLAEINLPFLDEPGIPAKGNYINQHTKDWSEVVRGYDGFVLVFPQYNWGYPAVLKNAMDYLYDEWKHKPVCMISYGGHGGFQAALGMKLVTQGLHMYNMATNPAFDIDEEMFDANGQFIDIDSAFSKYRQPIKAAAVEFADLLVK